MAASTFSASISELVQALDSINAPGSIYFSALAESAASFDSIAGAYLWNDIGDNPETWTPTGDNAETWTPISTAPETWTPISDSSETWTEIADNSETWTPIER